MVSSSEEAGGVNVLGLDCATQTGWAVVEVKGGLTTPRQWGVVRAGCGPIEDLVDHLSTLPLTSAALEAPYLDKNVATTITLARLVGRWEQELDRRKVPTVLVKAAEWQMGLLRGFISHATTRPARKRAAQLWVRTMYKLRVSEDEADALALATWHAKKLAWEIAIARR
jgi:Holliday junction resolvasome RuvABC endonuclease subunit